MKLKKKTTLRSIKIKTNRNQNNENQIQNNYKLEDTPEFLKAWNKYQGIGERKEGWEKKNSSSFALPNMRHNLARQMRW